MDLCKVRPAELLHSLLLCRVQRRHHENPSHEFVMVHPLSRFGDARIRREIVRIAFALAQRDEVGVGRIEVAGDIDAFDELHGEVIVGAARRREFLTAQLRPVEVPNFVNGRLISIECIHSHRLAPG